MEDYHLFSEGAVLSNPLIMPNNSLLLVDIEKIGFLKKPVAHFSKKAFDVVDGQSALGEWTAYDFFSEEGSREIVEIGMPILDSILRILPADETEESDREFMLGENVIENAITRGYLGELSYEAAIMKIVDLLVDGNCEEPDQFDDLMIQQIDSLRDSIYQSGKSDELVYQVTKQGVGEMVAFPRGYFDDFGGDNKRKDRKTIGELLGGLIPQGGALPQGA